MKALTLRLTDELYQAIKEAAKADNRSINSYISVTVAKGMKK